MGGGCSAYGGYTGFWWRKLMESYHLEDPDVNGKKIFGLQKV